MPTSSTILADNGSKKGSPTLFNRVSSAAALLTGRPLTFFAALLLVIVWAVTGPMFGFSDTWQLVINTGTTIVTFLMVFLIQNTQNRDTIAIQLKLDELILAVKAARNEMLDIENQDDEELSAKLDEMAKLAEAARETEEALSRASAVLEERIGEK